MPTSRTDRQSGFTLLELLVVLVILGLLTPVGALAISGTMTVAAYQHISTAGFNIYVLELVLLYLGGSLALLFNGPGRFSFDAGIMPALLVDLTAANEVTFMATVKANTTQSLALTIGTAAGNKMIIHAPAVQILNPSKQELNGSRLIGYDLRLVPTSAGTGNDELRIVTQ